MRKVWVCNVRPTRVVTDSMHLHFETRVEVRTPALHGETSGETDF